MRLDRIVSARKSRNRVEQDDDVALFLDHALGLFDHHLGDLHMALGRFIEGGADHFRGFATALHFGDFLGALIDQQDEQIRLRIVLQNRVRQFLHEHGFARARRRDDQAARPLADRADKVEHARRQFIGLRLQQEAFIRK